MARFAARENTRGELSVHSKIFFVLNDAAAFTFLSRPLLVHIALAYTLFALIATGANIAAQDLVIRGYSGAFAIELSVAVGTGVGLVIKYLLDKRFIFRFQARNLSHDGKTFVLYASMGIVTTLIFWSVEFGFEYLFHVKALRYLGAIIGLSVGYFTKYQLDRRYVFRKARVHGARS